MCALAFGITAQRARADLVNDEFSEAAAEIQETLAGKGQSIHDGDMDKLVS